MDAVHLHFRIDGADLVRIARDRVIEGDWEHGTRIVQCVVGETNYNDAYAILAGKKTLVGDEHGMTLEDEGADEAARVRDTQLSCYAGRFRWKGCWWVLYAKLGEGSYFTAEDAGWAQARGRNMTALSWSATKRGYEPLRAGDRVPWQSLRPLYYADDPERDLLLHDPDDGVRFAKTTTPPPPWLNQRLNRWTPETAMQSMPSSRLSVIYARGRALSSMRRELDETAADLTEAIPRAARSGHGVDALVDAARDQAEQEARLREAEAHRRAARQAEREEAEERRWQDYKAECARIREAVRTQAGPMDGPGWITLQTEDGTDRYRVPYAPFVRWAQECERRSLGRTDSPVWSINVTWTACSPSGLKLTGDIPEHTDWMLGAQQVWKAGTPCARDCDIESDYRDHDGQQLMEIARRRAYAMAQPWTARETPDGVLEVDVLVPGAAGALTVHPTADMDCTGKIAILPDASPRWGLVAQTADGIIVETGGALAHVVVVNRERGCPVVRIPEARKHIPAGVRVVIQGADVSVEDA